MRTWLLLAAPLVLTLGGCRLDNPEFGDDESSSESSEVGSEDPSAEGSEEVGSEEDSEGQVCELYEGQFFSLDAVPTCGGDNGGYSKWLQVLELEGNGWRVLQCTGANCEDCPDDVITSVSVGPVVLSELAGPGACVHMRAQRPPEADTGCEYSTMTLEVDSGNGPELILAARTAEGAPMAPTPSNPAVSGWSPGMFEAESCPCDLYPDETCCGGKEPTEWAYEVGGQDVFLGDSGEVTIGQRDYEFHAFGGYQSGECDSPREVAWALTLL